MPDEIEKLRFKEKNDNRFTLVKFPVPQGYITGKWWGPKNVRPILCIHGWMDNCGSFDRLIPLLSKELSFLAIDLPGHGTSTRYAPGMIYSYIDVVLLIERIRKVHKWEKVSLMGHSFGSFCCFFYSSVFADTTDLLISLDNFSPQESNAIFQLKKNLGQLLWEDDNPVKGGDLEPRAYSHDQLIKKLVKGSLYSVDEENAKYLLTRCVKKSAKEPKKYYFNFDRRIRGIVGPACGPEDALILTRHIICPALALFARDSYMRKGRNVPPPEKIKEVKENFYFHYGPGNHHFHLTHPEAYFDVINDFLARNRELKGKL